MFTKYNFWKQYISLLLQLGALFVVLFWITECTYKNKCFIFMWKTTWYEANIRFGDISYHVVDSFSLSRQRHFFPKTDFIVDTSEDIQLKRSKWKSAIGNEWCRLEPAGSEKIRYPPAWSCVRHYLCQISKIFLKAMLTVHGMKTPFCLRFLFYYCIIFWL